MGMNTKREIHPPITHPDGKHITIPVPMNGAEYAEASHGARDDGYPSVKSWIAYLIAERRVMQALRRRRRDRLL